MQIAKWMVEAQHVLSEEHAFVDDTIFKIWIEWCYGERKDYRLS